VHFYLPPPFPIPIPASAINAKPRTVNSNARADTRVNRPRRRSSRDYPACWRHDKGRARIEIRINATRRDPVDSAARFRACANYSAGKATARQVLICLAVIIFSSVISRNAPPPRGTPRPPRSTVINSSRLLAARDTFNERPLRRLAYTNAADSDVINKLTRYLIIRVGAAR